jgi:hypothetical protein
MCGLAFVFSPDLDSRDPPEVVTGILTGAVDQQIFFFIDQVFPVKLSYLEVGSKLNGVGRAGLFAIATKNATREVNAEKLWITSTVFILSRLKCDAIDRTRDRTQVASYTSFAAVRIA